MLFMRLVYITRTVSTQNFKLFRFLLQKLRGEKGLKKIKKLTRIGSNDGFASWETISAFSIDVF